ncbi:hypothetical protein AVEN_119166-1, partial [Araneus ventricosus]
ENTPDGPEGVPLQVTVNATFFSSKSFLAYKNESVERLMSPCKMVHHFTFPDLYSELSHIGYCNTKCCASCLQYCMVWVYCLFQSWSLFFRRKIFMAFKVVPLQVPVNVTFISSKSFLAYKNKNVERLLSPCKMVHHFTFPDQY